MDLSPEDLRVLRLARTARTPAASDKARVASKLALALGASAVAVSAAGVAQAAGTGSLTAKSLTAASLLKWWLASSVLLTAAVGSYLALSSPLPAPAASALNRRDEQTNAQRASTSLSPGAAIESEVAHDPQTASPGDGRTPTESAAAQNGEPSETAMPATTAPRASRRLASKRGASTGDRALAAELALLHRAQRAWRGGDPQQARGLLRVHQRSYPRSSLALERAGLSVLVACDLGDKAEAIRMARQVMTRAPDSPLRTSIEQSCALK